jgi:hypothetical protein
MTVQDKPTTFLSCTGVDGQRVEETTTQRFEVLPAGVYRKAGYDELVRLSYQTKSRVYFYREGAVEVDSLATQIFMKIYKPWTPD